MTAHQTVHRALTANWTPISAYSMRLVTNTRGIASALPGSGAQIVPSQNVVRSHRVPIADFERVNIVLARMAGVASIAMCVRQMMLAIP